MSTAQRKQDMKNITADIAALVQSNEKKAKNAAIQVKKSDGSQTTLLINENEFQELMRARKAHEKYGKEYDSINTVISALIKGYGKEMTGTESVESHPRGAHLIYINKYMALSEEQRQELRDEHGALKIRIGLRFDPVDEQIIKEACGQFIKNDKPFTRKASIIRALLANCTTLYIEKLSKQESFKI